MKIEAEWIKEKNSYITKSCVTHKKRFGNDEKINLYKTNVCVNGVLICEVWTSVKLDYYVSDKNGVWNGTHIMDSVIDYLKSTRLNLLNGVSPLNKEERKAEAKKLIAITDANIPIAGLGKLIDEITMLLNGSRNILTQIAED